MNGRYGQTQTSEHSAHILFIQPAIYPSIDSYLGFFHLLAFGNDAGYERGSAKTSPRPSFHPSGGSCPDVELCTG